MKDSSIEKNSAYIRWANKSIKESKILFDINNLHDYTSTCKTQIQEDSLMILANTDVENVIPRPTCRITINFNEQDFSLFNRYRAQIFIKAVGHKNFYVHFPFGNNDGLELHTESIIPNEWNNVIFEIGRIKRDKVSKVSIDVFLFGTPPEGLPEIEVYLKEIVLEKVDGDYDLGYDLEDRISYSQTGYLFDMEKIAICQGCISDTFYLFNEYGYSVYSNKIKKEETRLGYFDILDFTDFNIVGNYYLKVDNRKTNLFAISNYIYEEAITKTLNFYYSLRCGEEVEGVHSACHLNCRSVNENGDSVPNFGGWHDAGDLSQFEICTGEMAHALLDLSNINNDNSKLIIQEAKVGVDWLLRTRFGNGERALAVSYGIWRSNLLKVDNKTVFTSKAENGPFENFLAAACLIEAYKVFKDTNIDYANWCKRCAIEDFEFAKIGYENGIYSRRWGPSITSQTSGEGCFASSLLYEATKEEKYLLIAKEYAQDIISCQEKEYVDEKKTIRGFFYEDKEHKYVLSYEHRGHEQTPIQALVKLCEVAPSIEQSWMDAINMYSEYIINTTKYTYPYNIMPAGIYIINKVNIDHFTVPNNKQIPREEQLSKALTNLKEQIKSGIKINEGIYLRVYPIAIQRRGFFATLLSKTKAVTCMANFLNNKQLKQIAINQIEWILGKNPFASSTMYGFGYNYHPLYVAFSRQMVGALPVGIKTYKEFDLPYWPTINNAVYKEIWGHTSGKFLWVLADLIKQ